MSGSKSVDKAARKQERKRLQNRVLRSKTRTILRQARETVATGDVDTVQTSTVVAASALDRATTKGLFHKNKAARLKSRLMKRANARVGAQA